MECRDFLLLGKKKKKKKKKIMKAHYTHENGQ